MQSIFIVVKNVKVISKGEQMQEANFKKIRILATGGTIAGKAENALQMTGYESGIFSVDDLLNAVPGLDKVADITGEQISNIGSQDMTEDILLKLAKRCEVLLAQDDVDGIVITHGTDTMEETAYFLHLTVHSNKPIVLVGAMRPATAISADGPLNLLNAVKVAADAHSWGKGVMVVMNDEIYCGRDVSKTNTSNAATFKAPALGAMGLIVDGKPTFYYASLRKHTVQSEFWITDLEVLPRVDIIYTHIHEDGMLIKACIEAGAKGIVYAGSGMGSLHQNAFPALVEARRKNIAVVRSSRTGSGIVAPGMPEWTKAGFLDSDSLNPQKARILVQLALTVTTDNARLQEIFNEY